MYNVCNDNVRITMFVNKERSELQGPQAKGPN